MSVAVIDARGGSWPNVPNKPPKAFSPPEPPQAQGANCNAFDDDCAQVGFPGGQGGAGVPGVTGGTGGNGGSISFVIGVLNGAVKFTAAGGQGGRGGDGGDGGDGGKGGRGGNGNDCEFGLVGGNGGSGGAGGPGGNGGGGGNGGSVFVRVRTDNSTNNDPLTASGVSVDLGARAGKGVHRARRVSKAAQRAFSPQAVSVLFLGSRRFGALRANPDPVAREALPEMLVQCG